MALNLAYLNIPKFRYISIVAERLGKRLQALPVAAKLSVKNTPWFRQLDDLSRVDPKELEWPSLTKKQWVNAPGFWGVLYNLFFYWRLGRGLSLLATAYALTLLILGVGYTSGAMVWLREYFDAHIGRHFFWSTVAALWPIITILAGEYVCRSAGKFVSYQTQNLEDEVVAKAEEAVDETKAALNAEPEAAPEPAPENPKDRQAK